MGARRPAQLWPRVGAYETIYIRNSVSVAEIGVAVDPDTHVSPRQGAVEHGTRHVRSFVKELRIRPNPQRTK
jgi:hypothetical protein